MKWFGSSEKKESEDYEKKYLARYKKQQKPKQKKNTTKNKKDVEIESDEKNQVEDKIQKKEPESLSTKFESVKQEYNVIIKNLMDAKKELKNIKKIFKNQIVNMLTLFQKLNLLGLNCSKQIVNFRKKLKKMKKQQRDIKNKSY